MVKSSSFVFSAALVVLSLCVGESALAGAGGPSGDGISIVREVGGVTNLVITDTTRSGDSNAFTYALFGEPGDKVVCGDWNGDGNKSLGAVRADPGGTGALWIRDLNGDGATIVYDLFGDFTDTPVPGDWDSNTPGDEMGMVRVDGASLNWILKDNTANACQCSQTSFGGAADAPAPGNWNGDPADGTEKGVTRADSGTKLWITEGSGGLDYALFGASTDAEIPGDYSGDGNSQLGVVQNAGGANLIVMNGTSLGYLLFGASTDAVLNCGNL